MKSISNYQCYVFNLSSVSSVMLLIMIWQSILNLWYKINFGCFFYIFFATIIILQYTVLKLGSTCFNQRSCFNFYAKNKTTLKKNNLCSPNPGGGALNFGLHVMCHQKDPTFFAHFHQLSPNDPLFLINSLSPKEPVTSLSLRPFIFAFNNQNKWQFLAKNLIFRKFDEMLRN